MIYEQKRRLITHGIYATIITALIAVIKQFTFWGAVAFAVVSVALVLAYNYIEVKHIQEIERGKKKVFAR